MKTYIYRHLGQGELKSSLPRNLFGEGKACAGQGGSSGVGIFLFPNFLFLVLLQSFNQNT